MAGDSARSIMRLTPPYVHDEASRLECDGIHIRRALVGTDHVSSRLSYQSLNHISEVE